MNESASPSGPPDVSGANRGRPTGSRRPGGGREGFSLVELVVSLVILTIGLLGLAATTGYLIRQVQIGQLRTERAAAVQEVVEELRATPFTQITSRASSDAVQVGRFHLWWGVASSGSNLAHVSIYSLGPGYAPGQGWTATRQDSFRISLARLGVTN